VFSSSLPLGHGKEGLWHREWAADPPEMGFISASPAETSL